MSQQSISDKSLVIRNETQEYANTRGRVADVIDDLNLTKANKEDVDAAVQLIVDELGVTEQEIYAYIDAQNSAQNTEIAKKIDKPLGNTGSVSYTLLNDQGAISWRAIVMNDGWVPQYSNNSFINSSIYQHPNSNVGIGTTAPSVKLHVAGDVQGNSMFLPPNSNPATAYRLRSDGSDLYFANGSSVERKLLTDGTAIFPTTGNNGDILEKDSTVTGGVKWVDRLGGLTANFAPIWNGLKMINSIISQNAGKIGIGTTSPAEMLDVNGRVKATSVILPANGNTAVANRLRSDGTKLYYANDSAVERGISFDSVLRYGSQNPPTIAELTALGIQRGEFYVQTSNGTSSGTEVQRALFNGIQLVDWAVTSAVYATLSQAQKDAVKYISIAG